MVNEAPAPPAADATSMEALLASLSNWPPLQRTRDASVRRLVQSLSGPGIVSQHYGVVPEPEAQRAAAAIEAEARSPASVHGGFEGLPISAYALVLARRAHEFAKFRAAAAAAPAEAGAKEEAAAPEE